MRLHSKQSLTYSPPSSSSVFVWGVNLENDNGAGLLGICFWREAPETAVGADRRVGKRGLAATAGSGSWNFMMECESRILARSHDSIRKIRRDVTRKYCTGDFRFPTRRNRISSQRYSVKILGRSQDLPDFFRRLKSAPRTPRCCPRSLEFPLPFSAPR